MAFSGKLRWVSRVALGLGIIFGVLRIWQPLWGDLLNNLLWAIPLVVFHAVLISQLVRAPFNMWKQKDDALTELTSEQLRVQIEECPEPAETGDWWHLIVENPNNVAIEDCFGQISSFKPNKSKKPYEGLNLPWSSWTTRNMEKYTIPPKGKGKLDLILHRGNQFSIMAFSVIEGIRTPVNFEPIGEYSAEIIIGSLKKAFEPSRIRLTITLDEHDQLQIKGKPIKQQHEHTA